jgi:exodeoxyribonuclease V alpha subunit
MKIANKINERVASKIDGVDLPLLKDGLSKLFSPLENGQTDWQKLAAFVSVLRKFCVVSGGPGTGKSTLIARIIALRCE